MIEGASRTPPITSVTVMTETMGPEKPITNAITNVLMLTAQSRYPMRFASKVYLAIILR